MAILMTIERFILEQERLHPEATGAFTSLLYDLALAAKIIARETTRAGLGADILGEMPETNPSGEQQQKLDVFAHDTLFKINDHTGRVCVMASEEHDDILPIPEKYEAGNYVLVFDPLDGSSNIDVNVSVGTIFSIFRKISDTPRGALEDVLQAGKQLVAAGYVVYGSSTMLVYSAGHGVHGFTLDPSLGEFLLSHPDIRIPETPSYYSVNHSYMDYWTPGVQRYVRWLRERGSKKGDPSLSLRYSGSLVPDFHRNLIKGGVYLYPGNLHMPSQPNGKLRLLYETAPLAYLAYHAGGYGSDGAGDVLDIVPHHLHQRTPFFVGHKRLVKKAEQFIQEYDQAWLEAYIPRREGRASEG